MLVCKVSIQRPDLLGAEQLEGLIQACSDLPVGKHRPTGPKDLRVDDEASLNSLTLAQQSFGVPGVAGRI